MNWNIEEAIRRTGVLSRGHFLLSSGRHSGQYMQCAKLLQYPEEAEQAGRALADLFREERVEVVIGPALGGIIIAHETARSLGVRCLFAERKDGVMQLRRGFAIEQGERVLVVEDVVTTGGSVREVIRLVESLGGQVIGVGSLIDRSGGVSPFAVPFRSLLRVDIQSYSPGECPLCREGIPAEKPGSREQAKKL